MCALVMGSARPVRPATDAAAVRPAAVAGSFYPGDPTTLRADVEAFLASVHPTVSKGRLVALMVPHAGYEYSGKVAATSYKTLNGGRWRRIILIGPSHYVAFDGFAVDDSSAWRTPLGDVPVDRQTATALLARDRRFRVFPPAHAKEHALETQLPFLQVMLKDFAIVPITVGSHDPEDATVLADALVDLLRDAGTLVIVSCDLSHYYAYERAVAMDGAALLPISKLDVEGLQQALATGVSEIDAPGAVLAMVLALRRMGLHEMSLLTYANSGDVTGENSRVVGYGALAAAMTDEPPLVLDDAARTDLLRIARRTITEALRDGRWTTATANDQRFAMPRGVFVTITEAGQLRGCIGTIEPVMPLVEAVQHAAASAATHDPRFQPMTPRELDQAQLEISILSPLEPVQRVDEIRVGMHGLYLVHGDHSGLLLPQVAPEQGWDREQLLDGVCRKAGLPADAWRSPEARLYRFTVEHFSDSSASQAH